MSRSLIQARNPANGVRISCMLGIVPFEYFGTSFNSSSFISVPGDGADFNRMGLDLISYSFDTVPTGNLYQTLTLRVDLSDGSWFQQVISYYPYWVNGYGVSTLVTGPVTVSSPAPPTWYPPAANISGNIPYVPIPPGPYTPNGSGNVNTGTVLSRDITFTFGGLPSTGPTYTATFTATLSNPITRASLKAVSLLALDSYPLASVPSPARPSPNGSHRYDISWPDSASTFQLTTNASFNYKIAAALGMTADSSGAIVGGSICSGSNGSSPNYSGFPLVPVIFSAKSTWYLTSAAYSSGAKPSPPYEIYYHALNSSFVPQSVVDTGLALSYASVFYTFTPSTTVYDFSHIGSDIPSYPFSGPYAAPYSPGSDGEIGFNSAAT